jgi:hypothetical protein
MIAMHNRAYVKGVNGLDEDIRNALSGPSAESNFLSLFLLRSQTVSTKAVYER